jgi:hypothetical protein
VRNAQRTVRVGRSDASSASRAGVDETGTGLEETGTGLEELRSGLEETGSGVEENRSGVEETGTEPCDRSLGFVETAIRFDGRTVRFIVDLPRPARGRPRAQDISPMV